MTQPLRYQASFRFLLKLEEYMNPAPCRRTYHQLARSRIPPSRRSLRPRAQPRQPAIFVHQHRRIASTAPSSSSSASAAATAQTTAPPPQTYYTLFPQTLPQGPPPFGPFSLNSRALRTEFLKLQTLYHPDRHQTSSTQASASGTSALVNEAYRTLLSPLLRAQYLLKLRGIDVVDGEGESAKVEDMELLEEVMEIRGAIEAAEGEGEVEGLKEENDGRIEECVKELEAAFKEDDLEGAHKVVVRLRYWENVRESLDGWEKGKAGAVMH